MVIHQPKGSLTLDVHDRLKPQHIEDMQVHSEFPSANQQTNVK